LQNEGRNLSVAIEKGFFIAGVVKIVLFGVLQLETDDRQELFEVCDRLIVFDLKVFELQGFGFGFGFWFVVRG